MAKIKRQMPKQPTGPGTVVREPAVTKSGPALHEGSLTLADAQSRLLAARLRATRPRVAILRLLVANGHRHVTPEGLWAEVQTACMRLSLATVYNNLNAFTEAGLLTRIVVGPRQVFFDTDTRHHHHVYYEEGAELRSVPARQDGLVDMPDDLAHVEPQRLDVLVRVRTAQAKESATCHDGRRAAAQDCDHPVAARQPGLPRGSEATSHELFSNPPIIQLRWPM